MPKNTTPPHHSPELAALLARFAAWQAGRKFVVSE